MSTLSADAVEERPPPGRRRHRRRSRVGRLARGNFAAASGTTLGTLVTGLVSSMITSRLVGAERIGQFAIAGAPVLLALTLSGLDEQRLIVKSAGTSTVHDSFWAVLTVSIRLTAKVCVGLGLGAIVLYSTVLHLGRFILPSLAMLTMYCLLDNTISSMDGALLAAGRVLSLTIVRVATPILYAGTVLVMHFAGFRFWVLIVSQAITSTLVLLARALLTRRLLFGRRPSADRSELVAHFSAMQLGLLQFSIVFGALRVAAPYIVRRNGTAFLGAYTRCEAITSRIWSFFALFELARFRGVQDGFASDQVTAQYYRRLKVASGVLLPLATLVGVATVLMLPVYGRSFEVAHRERISLLGLAFGMESVAVLALAPIWARFDVKTLMRRRTRSYLPAVAFLVVSQLLRFEVIASITGATCIASVLQMFGTTALLKERLDGRAYNEIRSDLRHLLVHFALCGVGVTLFVTSRGSLGGTVAVGLVVTSVMLMRVPELVAVVRRR